MHRMHRDLSAAGTPDDPPSNNTTSGDDADQTPAPPHQQSPNVVEQFASMLDKYGFTVEAESYDELEVVVPFAKTLLFRVDTYHFVLPHYRPVSGFISISLFHSIPFRVISAVGSFI
jgi:hypothetical protein